MNKTLLMASLPLLAAALPVAAQTNPDVALYGRVDLGVARTIGSDVLQVRQGSGSRVGLRGSEDLGDGLKAIFNIEHRFTADNGQAGSLFWGGRSVVGLQGGFGTLVMGRDYTPARNVANKVDPWGGDTVAGHEGNLLGGFAPTRKANSITYASPALGGFSAQAQLELDEVEGNGNDATYGLAVNYKSGPLALGYGYDKAQDELDDAEWHIASARYAFGMVELSAALGFGDDFAGESHRSYFVGAAAGVGSGEIRVAYSQLENRDTRTDLSSRTSAGYHHKLSKRTTLYTDFAHEGEPNGDAAIDDNPWGVDFGIKHNF